MSLVDRQEAEIKAQADALAVDANGKKVTLKLAVDNNNGASVQLDTPPKNSQITVKDDGDESLFNFWSETGKYDARIFADKLTEEHLINTEDFQNAARSVYEVVTGDEWTATDGNDKELAEWAISHMRALDNNLGHGGKAIYDLAGTSGKQKQAFLYVYQAFEHKSWTGGGFVGALGRQVYDPTNWASVASLGFGFIGKAGAKVAAKKALVEFLKSSIKDNVKGKVAKEAIEEARDKAIKELGESYAKKEGLKLVAKETIEAEAKKLLAKEALKEGLEQGGKQLIKSTVLQTAKITAAVGAVEGAAVAGAESHFIRQKIELDGKFIEEKSLWSTLSATAFGGVFGGVFGGALGGTGSALANFDVIVKADFAPAIGRWLREKLGLSWGDNKATKEFADAADGKPKVDADAEAKLDSKTTDSAANTKKTDTTTSSKTDGADEAADADPTITSGESKTDASATKPRLRYNNKTGKLEPITDAAETAAGKAAREAAEQTIPRHAPEGLKVGHKISLYFKQTNESKFVTVNRVENGNIFVKTGDGPEFNLPPEYNPASEKYLIGTGDSTIRDIELDHFASQLKHAEDKAARITRKKDDLIKEGKDPDRQPPLSDEELRNLNALRFERARREAESGQDIIYKKDAPEVKPTYNSTSSGPNATIAKGDPAYKLDEYKTSTNHMTKVHRASWKPWKLFRHYAFTNKESGIMDSASIINPVIEAVENSMRDNGVIKSIRSLQKEIVEISARDFNTPEARTKALDDLNDKLNVYAKENAEELQKFNRDVRALKSQVEGWGIEKNTDGTFKLDKEKNPIRIKKGKPGHVLDGNGSDGRLKAVNQDIQEATILYIDDMIAIAENLQKSDFGAKGDAIRHLTKEVTRADPTTFKEELLGSINQISDVADGAWLRHARKNTNIDQNDTTQKIQESLLDWRTGKGGSPAEQWNALERQLSEGYYNPHQRPELAKFPKNGEHTWMNLEEEYKKLMDDKGHVNWTVPEVTGFVNEINHMYENKLDQEALYTIRMLRMRRGNDGTKTFPPDLTDKLRADKKYSTDKRYKYFVDKMSEVANTTDVTGATETIFSAGRSAEKFYAENSYFFRYASRYKIGNYGFGVGADIPALALPARITIAKDGLVHPGMKALYFFLGAADTKARSGAKPDSYLQISPDWGWEKGLTKNPIARALGRLSSGGITSKAEFVRTPLYITSGLVIGGTILDFASDEDYAFDDVGADILRMYTYPASMLYSLGAGTIAGTDPEDIDYGFSANAIHDWISDPDIEFSPEQIKELTKKLHLLYIDKNGITQTDPRYDEAHDLLEDLIKASTDMQRAYHAELTYGDREKLVDYNQKIAKFYEQKKDLNEEQLANVMKWENAINDITERAVLEANIDPEISAKVTNIGKELHKLVAGTAPEYFVTDEHKILVIAALDKLATLTEAKTVEAQNKLDLMELNDDGRQGLEAEIARYKRHNQEAHTFIASFEIDVNNNHVHNNSDFKNIKAAQDRLADYNLEVDLTKLAATATQPTGGGATTSTKPTTSTTTPTTPLTAAELEVKLKAYQAANTTQDQAYVAELLAALEQFPTNKSILDEAAKFLKEKEDKAAATTATEKLEKRIEDKIGDLEGAIKYYNKHNEDGEYDDDIKAAQAKIDILENKSLSDADHKKALNDSSLMQDFNLARGGDAAINIFGDHSDLLHAGKRILGDTWDTVSGFYKQTNDHWAWKVALGLGAFMGAKSLFDGTLGTGIWDSIKSWTKILAAGAVALAAVTYFSKSDAVSSSDSGNKHIPDTSKLRNEHASVNNVIEFRNRNTDEKVSRNISRRVSSIDHNGMATRTSLNKTEAEMRNVLQGYASIAGAATGEKNIPTNIQTAGISHGNGSNIPLSLRGGSIEVLRDGNVYTINRGQNAAEEHRNFPVSYHDLNGGA